MDRQYIVQHIDKRLDDCSQYMWHMNHKCLGRDHGIGHLCRTVFVDILN